MEPRELQGHGVKGRENTRKYIAHYGHRNQYKQSGYLLLAGVLQEVRLETTGFEPQGDSRSSRPLPGLHPSPIHN